MKREPENKNLKLGWRVYEIPCDKTEREYYQEILSEEKFKEWEHLHSPHRLSDIDHADYYRNDGHRGGLGKDFVKGKCRSFGSIDVLKDLWGQPWNNLALNYVSALNPASIRVTNGQICLDFCSGRITVMLREDDRTIDKITMEVTFYSMNGQSGYDLRCARDYQEENGSLDGYKCYDHDRIFINDKGTDNVD